MPRDAAGRGRVPPPGRRPEPAGQRAHPRQTADPVPGFAGDDDEAAGQVGHAISTLWFSLGESKRCSQLRRHGMGGPDSAMPSRQPSPRRPARTTYQDDCARLSRIRTTAPASYRAGIGESADAPDVSGSFWRTYGCDERGSTHRAGQGRVLCHHHAHVPHHGLPAAARCADATHGRAARRAAGCVAYRPGRRPAHPRPRRPGRHVQHAGLQRGEQRQPYPARPEEIMEDHP